MLERGVVHCLVASLVRMIEECVYIINFYKILLINIYDIVIATSVDSIL